MESNINNIQSDIYYRYKMPYLTIKVEGKGNGIKTVLTNISDIAKSLSRSSTYITKYFEYELGTQSHFDKKDDRYIINGEHRLDTLQNLIHTFIQKFVLCSNCKNPETFFIVKKLKIIKQCKSCGASIFITNHKLLNYIIKNPPEKTSCFLTSHTLSKDTEADRLDMFYEFLLTTLKQAFLDDKKKTELVITEAKRLKLKNKPVLLVCRAIFNDDPLRIISLIKRYSPLLLHFTYQNAKAQQYVLCGLESFFTENENVLSQISSIFKTLYDENIVEEQEFLFWETNPLQYITNKDSKLIRIKAQPFLKWLREAEEESE